MNELKSYMVPEMIADKSCGYYGYISLANGTSAERVVNIKYYRYSSGARYGNLDVTIPPRRVIALGDFQTNDYQPDGNSIFTKNLIDTSCKCVLNIRCDENVIVSPYIGTIKGEEVSAPCLGNVRECEPWT